MGTLSLAMHAEQTFMTPLEGVRKLYERHSETVYRTALRVTGNQADAEDILQTVFMRVLHQENSLDPETTPASYFRRAATNAALDILRRRTSRNEAPLDEGFGRASPESPAKTPMAIPATTQITPNRRSHSHTFARLRRPVKPNR